MILVSVPDFLNINILDFQTYSRHIITSRDYVRFSRRLTNVTVADP